MTAVLAGVSITIYYNYFYNMINQKHYIICVTLMNSINNVWVFWVLHFYHVLQLSWQTSLLMSMLGEMNIIQGNKTITGTLSYVPQDPWIFCDTLRENVLFYEEFKKDKYLEVLQATDLLQVCAQLILWANLTITFLWHMYIMFVSRHMCLTCEIRPEWIYKINCSVIWCWRI